MAETPTPEELLRKGLDLFWKVLRKKKKERLPEVANQYLQDAEDGLNRAEELLRAGQTSEASEIAMQAGNLLQGIDYRCAIANFREANRLQQEGAKVGKEKAQFFEKASKILDYAEQLLNEGEIKEAQLSLQEYHQQKVAVFGPPIFGF